MPHIAAAYYIRQSGFDTIMKQFSLILALWQFLFFMLSGCLLQQASANPVYLKIADVALGRPDKWDYIHFDPTLHLVFIAHETEITVLNTQGKIRVVGRVKDIDGAHGIATDPRLGIGFADAGLSGTLDIFDLKTFDVIKRIPTDRDSDAIAYDRKNHIVLVANGDANSLSLIDPLSGKRITNIPLGGSPEGLVVARHEQAFVNIADRKQLVRIDLHRKIIDARWPVPNCVSPHGLAFDPATNRLFSSCKNGKMIVLSAQDGREVAILPIGMGTDAAAFDPVRDLVFSSNADGTLSIIHEKSANVFSKTYNQPTELGARTMAEDPQSGRVFLVTANTRQAIGVHPVFIPGTVKLIVFKLIGKN